MEFIYYLKEIKSFQILLIVIVMDIVFGTLRAIKDKSLNSTFGINGIIRKVGMILSVIFMGLIQYIVKIDFISFVPTTIKSALNLETIGVDGLFLLLFNTFEILSIFKNMVLCGLPIPKRLQIYFEKILSEYTNEIQENKNQGGNNDVKNKR